MSHLEIYGINISRDNYINNCCRHAVRFYIKWLLDKQVRWKYEKFDDKAREEMCSDWNKDFDNEFWKSDDLHVRSQAYDLSGKKARESLYDLPYGDDLILFWVCALCPMRYENIDSVKIMCEDTEKTVQNAVQLIQNWIRKIIYKPEHIRFIKKIRQENWYD